jgi:hypothetical protein
MNTLVGLCAHQEGSEEEQKKQLFHKLTFFMLSGRLKI